MGKGSKGKEERRKERRKRIRGGGNKRIKKINPEPDQASPATRLQKIKEPH